MLFKNGPFHINMQFTCQNFTSFIQGSFLAAWRFKTKKGRTSPKISKVSVIKQTPQELKEELPNLENLASGRRHCLRTNKLSCRMWRGGPTGSNRFSSSVAWRAPHALQSLLNLFSQIRLTYILILSQISGQAFQHDLTGL